MENNNNKRKLKIHEQVATNTANIKNLHEKIDRIDDQVSNHIPSAIENLGDRIEKRYSKKWVESFMIWAIRIIIGMVIAALVGLVLLK